MTIATEVLAHRDILWFHLFPR